MIQDLVVTSSVTLPVGLIEEVMRLRALDPQSRRRSTRGGWSSTTSGPKTEQFPDLERFLRDVRADSFWFNINPPGSCNEWHTHTGFTSSGVLYLQACSGSGDIQFDVVTRETPQTFSISPTPGLLITFPSDLYHRVGKNESLEDRICLVFNSHLAQVEAAVTVHTPAGNNPDEIPWAPLTH